MTRREEIIKKALELDTTNDITTFVVAAQWADKTMIEKACKYYCDDICDKGRCGMCFHKYDDEYQVKNTFQYNECYELKFLRKAMEE